MKRFGMEQLVRGTLFKIREIDVLDKVYTRDLYFRD